MGHKKFKFLNVTRKSQVTDELGKCNQSELAPMVKLKWERAVKMKVHKDGASG
jgi:hypothetical protein